MVKEQEHRILVTPRSFGKFDPHLLHSLREEYAEVILNPLGRILTPEELSGLISGVDAVIAGVDEFNSSVIESAPGLKILARYGVGFDHVDVDACTRRGVIVTNAPGANSEAVAEMALGLMLAVLRSIAETSCRIRSGGSWDQSYGGSLAGAASGLIGFGAIGRQVANLLLAFGSRVLVYDPFLDENMIPPSIERVKDLTALLEEADVVSLHLPAGPKTANLVDAEFLASMKKGAILINTARGELIVEKDLLSAIRQGSLAGAGLDVFRTQPLPQDHPFLTCPNLVLTPHSASHTRQAVNTMGQMAVDCCLAVRRGRIPQNICNPEVLKVISLPDRPVKGNREG